MKKRYHTVNGMLIGETSNGVRRGYLPDALGSVVATVDNNGSIENTYRYKPYGSLLAKTGTAVDPRFMWIGVVGYRATLLQQAGQYVRARHYGISSARWTSLDPLGIFAPPYCYVSCNPGTYRDPSGLLPSQPPFSSHQLIEVLLDTIYESCNPKCCCEVQSLDLTPGLPRGTDEPFWYGFPDLTLSAVGRNRKLIGGEKSRRCKLAWLEKTNKRYGRAPVDIWFNVNAIPGLAHTYFPIDPHCPGGPVSYREVDSPHVEEPREYGTTRILCIRVEFHDGCTGKVSVKTFWSKTVTFAAGSLPKASIDGGSVPPVGELATYCRYP